ncbi:MAG: L-threonylcarbamoyladenylate synthase [Verrucomicrobiota bacterium]|jgi:L-threonylcarbamoyladenylate synthase
MQTEVLSTHTPGLFTAAVRRAVAHLQAGELVALPTETVYGLAANALDPDAVARVFKVKGRPAKNPIIVHVADVVLARACVADWPDAAQRLADAFWPGPLTLVLPKADRIPAAVTAGGPTVGIRWPSHPFIQAVIRECGFPLAAPSANASNQLSPTTAGHVLADLGGRIPLIVDGGPCAVGIESTVLDLAAMPPRILRPGMIHETALAAVLGEEWLASGPHGHAGGTLRSPGQLPKHYAPKTRLLVRAWRDDAELVSYIVDLGLTARDCWVIAHTRIPSAADFAGISVIPHDAAAFARACYAELHRGDAARAAAIIVEAVPATSEWRGVADRLRRAAV